VVTVDGILVIKQKFWSSREKAERKIAEQAKRLGYDQDPELGALEIEAETEANTDYRKTGEEKHAGKNGDTSAGG
jgi:hypothetical protein